MINLQNFLSITSVPRASRSPSMALARVASVLLFFSAGSFAHAANPDPVEQRSTVGGNWTIYCAKGVEHPTYADCSAVTSVKDSSDPDLWLKIGVNYVGEEGPAELTIRTPRLTYLKRGISVSADGHQIGRAFLDRCSDTSCETTIGLADRVMASLGIAEVLNVEYPTSEKNGVAFSVNFDGFVSALFELRNIANVKETKINELAKLRNDKIVSSSASMTKYWQYIVEPRAATFSESNRKVVRTWDEPVRGCPGLASSFPVALSANLKVVDDADLKSWITRTKNCSSSSVFWIKGSGYASLIAGTDATTNQELGKYIVYDAITKADGVPVLTDRSGRIPVNAAMVSDGLIGSR